MTPLIFGDEANLVLIKIEKNEIQEFVIYQKDVKLLNYLLYNIF